MANGVSNAFSNAANKSFYKVGDTTSSGSKVTASNVGYLNQAVANAASNAASPVTAQVNSYGGGNAINMGALAGAIASSGGSGSGGSGGSGSSNKTDSGTNAYDYLSSLMSDYAAQRRAQLEAAYNRARSNIEGAFSEGRGLLDANYNSGVNALNSSYNNSLNGLNEDANRSLREAYINKMLSNKNLQQKMSAMGLSGGATESTLANQLNNYGNARNEIETTRNRNISNLDAEKDSNMASLLQNYNTNLLGLIQQRANALANIENALASGTESAMNQQYSFQTSPTFLNSITSALANLNNFQGEQTSANNTPANLSVQQTNASDVSSATNYEKYMELLSALLGGSR